MTLQKAIWNNIEVTILDLVHKSAFGNLVKIQYGNTIKIVNSTYLKIIK